MFVKDKARALVEAGRLIAERGWCSATGGNFSVRLDDDHCLITQSGRDKSRLSETDLMVCTLDGRALEQGLRPSAETALHTGLYRAERGIGAVLHTHSVNATVLSRASADKLTVSGFEMQKALAGNQTHDESIDIAIVENDQDMQALATRVLQRLPQQPGFLVRGHGLYAWGSTIEEARRHVEAFEFLFACLWQERLLQNR